MFAAGQTSSMMNKEQDAIHVSIRMTTLNKSTVLSVRAEDLKFVISLRQFRMFATWPYGQLLIHRDIVKHLISYENQFVEKGLVD